MDFVVVDVETANQRPSSICQIGLACFRGGNLTETWGGLVNPEDSFLPFNTELHGIGPKTISKSPTWPDLQFTVRQFMEQRTIASHTFFDRAALNSPWCKCVNFGRFGGGAICRDSCCEPQ